MICNLVLLGFNFDLLFCCVGEDYYFVMLMFEWYFGVCIYYLCDFVNWEFVLCFLNCVDFFDMWGNFDSGGIWVLCLSYDGDKFWLVYIDVK